MPAGNHFPLRSLGDHEVLDALLHRAWQVERDDGSLEAREGAAGRAFRLDLRAGRGLPRLDEIRV